MKFQKLVENQFDQRIKIFQCDGRSEFNSKDFLGHIRTYGIKIHMSCPLSLKLNYACNHLQVQQCSYKLWPIKTYITLHFNRPCDRHFYLFGLMREKKK